jgi:hypothetical protein
MELMPYKHWRNDPAAVLMTVSYFLGAMISGEQHCEFQGFQILGRGPGKNVARH